ncbi:MAG TPA: acyltransferase [Jatrophihabitans sp.]|nr:acyltransferase [Jatrophihabitans sp.]
MTAPADRRFPALDGVRAFAAFGVVCTHVGFISGRSLNDDLLGPVLARGDFGVALFFVLSGFLLYRPFALHLLTDSPAPRVGRFLWRRAVRIVPAMVLFVVITLAFLTPFRVRASDYLQYLLLIQTYDHHDYDPNLAQLWTLTVEVSFYLFLPIVGSLAARWRQSLSKVIASQVVLLSVMAVLPALYNLWQTHYAPQSQALLWLPGYTDWFAIGMALALLTSLPAGATVLPRLRATLRDWAAAAGTCWLIAGVVFMISTLPVGIPRTLSPALFWQWTTQHTLYGISAFFLMLPLVLGEHPQLDRILGSRIGRFGGNISYGVYLWHKPLLSKAQSALGYHDFDGRFFNLLIATMVISVLAASASWYLIERPALRYATVPWRRLSARQPGPITPNTMADTHSS